MQSVEDEPRSEPAQAALAEALTKAGLAADPELGRHAEALRAAIDGAVGTGGAAIAVGDIFGKVNVLVSNLVASGRIKLGDIRADTGDATLTNLTAGADSPKKASARTRRAQRLSRRRTRAQPTVTILGSRPATSWPGGT